MQMMKFNWENEILGCKKCEERRPTQTKVEIHIGGKFIQIQGKKYREPSKKKLTLISTLKLPRFIKTSILIRNYSKGHLECVW